MNPQERDLKVWNWKLTEEKGKFNNGIEIDINEKRVDTVHFSDDLKVFFIFILFKL